jgi:ubiquinone/menaquinone biosynthesis C-methylase UbiE
MNYFGFKTAAERYAQGRPFFHAVVIRRAKEFLPLALPMARALDVGCGTGHSSVALKEMAEAIVGVDASMEMIAHAPRDARLAYAVALAERLPFGGRAFELMTLSQVSHWLDRKVFFAEARRVLCPAAWLLIYDAYFSARSVGSTDFQQWHNEAYLKRYPSPPRAPVALAAADLEGTGFQLRKHEQLQHTIGFTLERLVDYLLTQSNVIAAVEAGTQEIEEARRWLTENIKPFFKARAEADFLFNIPVWYLQAAAE